jgi:hypothetical protein
VAKFVGCHEETVRRAYWRGLLRSQRFGVRGRRFHPEDVRGAERQLESREHQEQKHVKEDVWQSEGDAEGRVEASGDALSICGST